MSEDVSEETSERVVEGTDDGSLFPDSPETASSASPAEAVKKKRAPNVPRPYPRRTLEDALRIPTAIKDNNGGQPWAPDQVASAVGMGMSNTFFYLTSAAREFGLTAGTREASVISITDLGHRAVYPGSDPERAQALWDAFFSVDLFKRVVEHYHGSKLPDEPFRTNTLTTTFSLDRSVVDEFVDLFEKNARFVGVGTDWDDTSTGTTEQSGSQPSTVQIGTPTKQDDTGLRCFIAMPFTEHDDQYPIGFFKEVLESLLKPAITGAGFKAITASRQGSDIIHATIVNDLLDADLVVVDLTEHNPNVLFELGMRMHDEKPVALVRAKGTGPIFDVDNMLRVADYNPNLWPSTVEKDRAALMEHIKAAWEGRNTTQTYMQILKRREGVS